MVFADAAKTILCFKHLKNLAKSISTNGRIAKLKEDTKNKKIMVIAAYTPRSKKHKIETFLNTITPEFREIVVLTRSDARFDLSKEVILYTRPLPKGVVGGSLLSIPLFFAQTVKLTIDCCKLVKKHKIDFCLSFWTHWQVGISLLLTRCICGTPYVLRIAGPLEIASLSHINGSIIKKITNTLVKQIVDNSALTISISQQLKEYIRYEVSSSQRILVIPHGIDITLFRPDNSDPKILANYGVPSEKKLILYAGRVVKQKGIDYLIDALPRVFSEMKSAHLVVVGDGPHLEHMMQRAKDMDLCGRITFTGSISNKEMPSFYNRCAVFILPSLAEGVPTVLLEAMACGLPVITTHLPWTRGMISHKENGYLIPPRDSDAIANSVLELLSNEELARRLGNSGRTMVLEKYNDVRLGARAIAKIINEVQSFPLSSGKSVRGDRNETF